MAFQATQVTNALNQVSTQVKNSQGQLVRSTDAQGYSNTYTYDPFGNLTQTLDAAGNRTFLSYDIRGRKVTMDDPDMGHWEYRYNALGELIYQRDAKGQIITMVYDKLGRMTKRTEPEGSSTWGYDGAVKGIGKLQIVTGPNGYLRTHGYDSLGRDSRTATTLDGELFTLDTGYDSLGRIGKLTYPTGFAIRYVYSPFGYLSEIRDTATGNLYWQGTARNPEGQLTKTVLGNGLSTVQSYDVLSRKTGITTGLGTQSNVQYLSYRYDSLGNVLERRDANQALTETFAYDTLNRLTSASLSGVGAKTYQYDSIGNITYKSDVGSYVYGNGVAGPHAVTSTSGIKNASYTYDANGNQLGGNGRTLAWASFNLPTRITQGSAADNFTYDPERVRISQVNNDGKTIYLNPRWDLGTHFEKITDTAGNVTYKHCIAAGGEIIAIRVIHGNGIQKTKYLHYDHIGSLDTTTDEAGQVIERLSYDAHGKRRQTNWRDATGLITSQVTTHGFTGHEHLDSVGLIHMNGRVYDPTLGRFLSADPQVQYPESTQGLNRYSYVENNPLSYTDPSGFGFFSSLFKSIKNFFRKFGRAILGVAVSFIPGINIIAAGFIVGVITGGDLKSGIIGALTAGAFGALHNLGFGLGKILAHGAVGGISSVAQGGKFGSGFLAAGVTQSLSKTINGINSTHPGPDIGRTVAAAVAGGAASVLGGGKFTNGAVTGAFSRLFNDDAAARASRNQGEQQRGRGLVPVTLNGVGTTYLDPEIAPMVQAFVVNAADGGVYLNFNSAFRTVDQQANLQNDPTAITPATLSLHSAGLAVDVNYSSLASDSQRTIVRNAASAAGLSWGGNFRTPDPPHFYYDPGGNRAQLINDAQFNYNLLN